MALSTSRSFLMAATAVTYLAGVLQLVGVATPNWIVVKDILHLGLWSICVTNPVGEVACVNWGTDVAAWHNASRAFGIIAVGAMIWAGAIAVVVICKSEHAIFMKAAALLCALGALCSLVSFAIFAAKYKELLSSQTAEPKFDYSFGLCVTAAILSPVASVLFLRGRRASGYSSLN